MTIIIIAIIALVAIATVLLLQQNYLGGKITYWANETQNEQNKVMKDIAGENSNYCIKTIGGICIGIPGN